MIGSPGSALALRPCRLLLRVGGTLFFVLRLTFETGRRRPEGWMERAALFTRAARDFCRVHGVEVELRGTFPPGPKVVVMNHLGYVDPLVLAASQPILPIAKSEVAGWPVVGAIGRALGVLFVIRGRPASGFRVLRRASRALRAGASVLNFAEGTTTTGHDVLPFHRGIFGIARHTGTPVVPVRLSFEDPSLAWVGDDAFLPHYLDFASRPGVRVTLEVLDRIDPADFVRAEDLAEATRSALRARIRDRRPCPAVAAAS